MNIKEHPRDKSVYPTYLGALLQFLENIRPLLIEELDDPKTFTRSFFDLQNRFDEAYAKANSVGKQSGHAALRRSVPYLERLVWFWLKDDNQALQAIVEEEIFRKMKSNKCDEVSVQLLKEQITSIFGEKLEERSETEVKPLKTHPISKPFLLLAGISGTGKTRFVREQAERTGSIKDTYCLVSVRPDWHEPSDLLGYTSRLSGKAEYIVTDVLQFIVKAWKEVIKSGISFDGTSLKGTKEQLASICPFWLCLDEMNLAPVEQYFADYLSILETRKWIWDGSSFVYSCDPLLKPTAFTEFFDTERFALQNNLGVHDAEELWNYFKENGISIPFNLIVVGTVNMDETTHGFSRKVIDRALSFDFGEFLPNNFDEYFEPSSQPKMLSYPHWSDARESRAFFPSIDSDGKKCIAFLKAVNAVLQDTPFQLAYRALNELLLSIVSHQPEDNLALEAVWELL